MYITDLRKKTLRWGEPFGGWNKLNVAHDYFTTNIANPDTGLCNRILHWEIAHFLNKKNNFKYSIMLNSKDWPELYLIDLPNTYTDYKNLELEDALYDRAYNELKFKTVFDVENNSVRLANKLNKSALNSIIKNNGILSDNHYYADFGYMDLGKATYKNKKLYNEYHDDIHLRPLSYIKLRHQFIEFTLREGTMNTIGVHMRRFNGVSIDHKESNNFKDKKLNKIYKELEENRQVKENYTFYGDDVYFELFDKILEINPSQKFYISHDLPDVFMQPYITRYGDRIMDKRFFTLPVHRHLHASGLNIEHLRRIGNVTHNIIDLFALSFCPFLITNQDSTWSEFAEYHDNSDGLKPINPIDWNVDDILESYNNSPLSKISTKNLI